MNLAMRQAGHTEKFRAMVTTRVIARYSQSMKNHRNKTKRMYRNKEEREKSSEEKGGKTTSSDWMRKGGFTAVINISATKDNKLGLAVEKALASCPSPLTQGPKSSRGQATVSGKPWSREIPSPVHPAEEKPAPG